MIQISEETLNLAMKYADHAEIYMEKERSVNVEVQKNKVDFAKEVLTLGMGVRVIIDGKMGFSHTTNMNNLKKTVENAVFNAKSNIVDENIGFAPKSKYNTVKDTYHEKIETLGIEEPVEFAKIMINIVKEEKCRPTSGGFSAGCLESLIVNSEGVVSRDRSTLFSGFISVNVKDKKGLSTAHESDSSRYFDIDAGWIAKEACRIAKGSLRGKSIETRNMDVVLDYHAGAGLLGTFVNALNADNVQRGRSVFAEKIGDTVVSPHLSIYDDGLLEKGLNSSKSDGEGIPSKKTAVIDKGVLKSFLYDIYTSNKSNVESTGNGMRSSFADTPSVGLSNFIVDFDDFMEISDIKDGLLVTDVLGAHTSNPISGDFSVEAMNAFKIDNGEITSPIKKAMLSGNIFHSMSRASAISKKTRQIGAFIIPRFLINDLSVVG